MIVDVPPARVRDRLAEAMAIYVAAMGYPSVSGSQRGTHMLRHAELDAFRYRVALDGTGDRCWPSATATPACPASGGTTWCAGRSAGTRELWLGNAFELSELHVTPAAQGRGLGERVLRSLADGPAAPDHAAVHPGGREPGLAAVPAARLRRPGPQPPVPRRPPAVRGARRATAVRRTG